MNIIVKKVLIFFTLSAILLSLDVPINKVVNLNIKIGEFSVVEFPFVVKGTNKATFLPHVRKVANGEKTSIKKIMSSSAPDSLVIKRGKNTFTFFPKKYGTLSLVIWGYSKHPIMLNINVVSNDAAQYYKFIDYSQNIEEAGKFESTSHEKVIVKLIKHLFNNKIPSGYHSSFEGREYKLNGLNFVLTNSLIGKNYRADEWIVKNLGINNINLYEEMFYADGIYAISFEATRLKPLEKCRMFIIRKNVE